MTEEMSFCECYYHLLKMVLKTSVPLVRYLRKFFSILEIVFFSLFFRKTLLGNPLFF